MKQNGLWFLIVWGAAVCIQAASIDIYTPAGEKGSCSTRISSVLNAAYRHYPSITASQKMILSAKAQVESARWNYFPTPSIDFSQGTAGRRGETYRIDQPLWTGGKIEALNDLAHAHSDEATYMLGESAYLLSEKVLSVMQTLIQADGEIKAFGKGRQELLELSKMLERRVGAGVSSEADQALVDARISQIDGDLMTARQHYEMARSQLQLLTGKKMHCSVAFKNDPLLKTKMSYGRMESTMLSTHPSLRKMDALVSAAKAEKKSADAVAMPNVSVRAEHYRGSLYDYETEQSNTLAYVAVSFNPGAGLSAMSDMESAKYRVMQAQDERMTREQELKDTLVKEYTNYTASVNNLKNLEYTIESTKTVLESYKRLFLAGKRQWLDLVNMSRELTMYHVNLASLRASIITSSYLLALQTGRIAFDKRER